MPHTPEAKKRAQVRISRIKGQMEALEQSLGEGASCSVILQQLSAVRGAVNGLMASVLESHLREEFTQVGELSSSQATSVEDVVSLVRSYLR